MEWLNKEYSIELHNPLTEEERDAILDVDMEHTTSVEFTTKHGRKVEFAKVRHGRWTFPRAGVNSYPFWNTRCSVCDWETSRVGACFYRYCPGCGAKMDGGDDGTDQ